MNKHTFRFVKGLVLLLAAALTMGLLSGCVRSDGNATPPEKTTVRVAALKGPTAMGMVQLMDESDAGNTTGEYDFQIAAAVDEISPLLMTESVDVAAVPANLASVLYNNTKGKVKVIALNTLGVLYLVESGDTVHEVADLKGKTIYLSGKGATPEYSLRHVLEANGLDPDKDVTLEFKSEHSECVALLAQNKNAIALLPQPFVTTAQMKDDTIRVALDLNELWEQSENSGALITGALVVRTAFAEEHKDALDTFLSEYKTSVDFVNANTDEAAQLVEKYGIVTAAVAQKALPECHIVYIDGAEMKEKLSGYLKVLFEQNEKAVGTKLPDDAFYYQK